MKTVTTILVVLSLLALTVSTDLKAQSNNYKNVTGNSIETLKGGIKSNNQGLRKSSIYMAGLYRIDEAVNVLTDQLKKEDDPGTKVLIALSLYNIGNPKGMEAVRDLSEKDQDAKVKRMSSIIYRTYIENCESVSQR